MFVSEILNLASRRFWWPNSKKIPKKIFNLAVIFSEEVSKKNTILFRLRKH